MSFNLIFMGTPEFGREFLEYIHSNVEFNIKAVYTQAPKKSNRGQKVNLSPVHKYAKDKNLNVFFPSKFTKSEIDNIKRIKPDVILVVAYGLILPEEVLMIPSCGSVNVHASLLPKWRGAAPIHRAIINGDEKTGISIMRMEKGLDEGPTYLQTAIPIGENDTYGDIYNTLVEAGKKTLNDYFFPSSHSVHYPSRQNPEGATYANKIKKSEIKINFNDTAYKAHKKICAFSPKPGAWFEVESIKYKIFDTKVLLNNDTKKFLDSEKLILPFKENFLLVNKIQKEGKNLMKIEDFRRGYSKDFEKIKKSFFKPKIK